MAWTAAGRQALQFPFDTVLGTLTGIGQTAVGTFAKQLILTPVAGINSNSKTYTFPLCCPDQEHGGFNLSTRARKVDCNLLVYPAAGGGTNISTVMFTEA